MKSHSILNGGHQGDAEPQSALQPTSQPAPQPALQQPGRKEHLGWIMLLYLLGLFIGAIGTGSITPVRTIIQSSLGVDDQVGIWMITIYTLCYAAIIPVSGKLADRHGRKIVFLISIFLFGAGSVICGLSAGIGSFAVLLAGRVISAIGAGGIMPIATAEFGTSFPEEKRGMALGMVGGVYGIGNVLGATAGSAILDIFGTDRWEWIFYANVPFCVFIIVFGFFFIPNHRSEIVYRIDKLGTLLITVIILSLLYGLKNLDFFDLAASAASRDVWMYLLIAAVLIPVFVLVEKRAEDPVFHIEYMSDRPIVLTLFMGMLVGCSMMGMIFIPQFAENCMKIPSGDGGYFVIILGVMAGIAAPVSGRLIDRFGSKPVLGAGFIVSVAGALYISFVAVNHVSLANVAVSLVLIGLGMGLTIGTPLNYMMLRHTKEEDSNSALATLSLVRSIGTAIAPAIMVGFIAQAGVTMQDDLMKEMPDIPEIPKMEQQVKLEGIIDNLNESQEFRKQMKENNIDLDKMLGADMNMDIDMTSAADENEMPKELLDKLQSSDVTTVTGMCETIAKYYFDEYTPGVISDIQGGIDEGIDGITKGIDGADDGILEMQAGVDEMDASRAKLKEGLDGIEKGIAGMEKGLKDADRKISDMKTGISKMKGALSQIPKIPETAEKRKGIKEKISKMEKGLEGAETGRKALETKLNKSRKERNSMKSAYTQMGSARAELMDAIEDAKAQRDQMIEAKGLMISMKKDVPQVFADTEAQYMKAIEDNHESIENTYQTVLNRGFRNMFICVAIFNIVGLILLLFYSENRKDLKKVI